LLRVWNQGRAHVPAFLDDHAALLNALLDLHRAGAGDDFVAEAVAVADDIAQRFFEADEGDLFLTPGVAQALVQRPRSDHDGATPHSAGLATLGLLRVASLCGRSDLGDLAERVLVTHGDRLEQHPETVPTLSRAALAAERGLSAAVIVSTDDDDASTALADRARRVLGPNDSVIVFPAGTKPANIDPTWLTGREPVDGRPAAYVCRGTECSLPVTDARELSPLPDGDDG
jgi:hypothetical protein